MKYDILIFDADETLLDFSKAEDYALETSLKNFDIDYNNEHLNIYKEVNRGVWDEFERELISVDDLKTERFKRFFKKLEMDLNHRDFSNEYLNNLSQGGFLFDKTLELLDTLHRKVKLVLLTNGLAKVQRGRLKMTDLMKYFDSIVISEEIGYSKPNSKIFLHALSSVKCNQKDRVLMIGDSLKSDILGGINFGIDTCWYNPRDTKNETRITPTYEIKDLLEILDIIK